MAGAEKLLNDRQVSLDAERRSLHAEQQDYRLNATLGRAHSSNNTPSSNGSTPPNTPISTSSQETPSVSDSTPPGPSHSSEYVHNFRLNLRFHEKNRSRCTVEFTVNPPSSDETSTPDNTSSGATEGGDSQTNEFDQIMRDHMVAWLLDQLNRVADGTEWHHLTTSLYENSKHMKRGGFVWVIQFYFLSDLKDHHDDRAPTKYISTSWGWLVLKLRPLFIVDWTESTVSGHLCYTYDKRTWEQLPPWLRAGCIPLQRVAQSRGDRAARTEGFVRVANYEGTDAPYMSREKTTIRMTTPMARMSGFVVEDDWADLVETLRKDVTSYLNHLDRSVKENTEPHQMMKLRTAEKSSKKSDAGTTGFVSRVQVNQTRLINRRSSTQNGFVGANSPCSEVKRGTKRKADDSDESPPGKMPKQDTPQDKIRQPPKNSPKGARPSKAAKSRERIRMGKGSAGSSFVGRFATSMDLVQTSQSAARGYQDPDTPQGGAAHYKDVKLPY